MIDAIVVLTTTGDRDEADNLARQLVECRLAACVQIIGPMTSVYRWQGTVEESIEWLCVIKTRQPIFSQLNAAIHELHSYDVPEIVALPITDGSEKYLQWLTDELRDEG